MRTGAISVDDNAGTTFTPDEKGNRRYLTVDAAQAEAIKNHFVKLVTAKPRNVK